MTRYVIKRILQAIPTLLGVTLLAFVVVRMTGDPTSLMLPPDATDEAIAEFRAANGLDRSLPVQYGLFLKNALTLDLGLSIRYRVPVNDLIMARAPATIRLAVSSIALAVLVGLPIGLIAALKHGKLFDRITRGFALTAQAIPSFYLGIVLIIIFGVWLRLVPTVGDVGAISLILPTVTLAAFMIPLILRVARGSLLDVINQDYVRTARSKGLPRRRVLWLHMLKNSLIPVVTIVGLQVGAALSGAVVTETVFAWPGIGRLLIEGINSRDFPVVQGVVLVTSATFVLVNLLVDLMYGRLDPRITLR